MVLLRNFSEIEIEHKEGTERERKQERRREKKKEEEKKRRRIEKTRRRREEDAHQPDAGLRINDPLRAHSFVVSSMAAVEDTRVNRKERRKEEKKKRETPETKKKVEKGAENGLEVNTYFICIALNQGLLFLSVLSLFPSSLLSLSCSSLIMSRSFLVSSHGSARVLTSSSS